MEQVCSCGRIMGVLLECVICEKSCCIMCVSEGNISLCLECKLTQLDLLEKQGEKREQKRHQEEMAKCMICEEPRNRREDCGFCGKNLRYCPAHMHICGKKTRKDGTCIRLICHEHEYCEQHTPFCRNCKKPIRDLDVIKCTYKSCRTSCCPECVIYIYPYRDKIGFICTKHYSMCLKCLGNTMNSQCSHPTCYTKRCHHCNGFQLQDGWKIFCDNHIKSCEQCEMNYPYLFSKILIVPRIGVKNICSNCYNRNNQEFLTLMKILVQKNIVIPLDIRIMLWQYLVL